MAGADRVLSMDLHAGQIQGFFDIPTDNLYAAPVISADIQARFSGRNLMVVSPDVGGVVRARALSKRLDNAPLAIVDKRRERPGESEVMNIIGDPAGRFCILVDDIVDSAGTLCNAAAALREAGAEDVVAYVSHGVLSGGAVARVEGSVLTRAGRDRFDHGAAGGGGREEGPPADDRAAAGRGDQADRRRKLGVVAVRLMCCPLRASREREGPPRQRSEGEGTM